MPAPSLKYGFVFMGLIMEFDIDGIHYIWEVNVHGEIRFSAFDTNDKLKIFSKEEMSWDWDGPAHVLCTDNTGVAKNSLRVFREVADISEKWIRMRKPYYFYFICGDDKKYKIYGNLVRRFRKKFPGYSVIESFPAFYFYLN